MQKGGHANVAARPKADLLAGLWYVNIHSDNFQGGEIRGQIVESDVVSGDSESWGAVKDRYQD